MLYQDIIKYSLSSRIRDPFKIWQIGNWLLKYNRDYCNYYASGSVSKIPQSNKAKGIIKRIKRYLYNLQKWGLVEQLGLVDSDSKNGLKTPLYCFTTEGYIVAWIIKYDDAYQMSKQKLNQRNLEEAVNRMKKAKHEIYDLFKRLFSEFSFFND